MGVSLKSLGVPPIWFLLPFRSCSCPLSPPSLPQEAVKPNLTASLSEKKQGGSGLERNTTEKVPAQAKKGDWLRWLESCDLYDGKWVMDDSYPLYIHTT